MMNGGRDAEEGELIDWARFQSRVNPGVMVRFSENHPDLVGILLETYPYHNDEFNSRYAIKNQDLSGRLNLLKWAELRYEWVIENSFIPRHKTLDRMQYFIDGRWLTYDEVMA